VFDFVDGQGGGTDKLVFSGFGASAITSQVVSSGSLNRVLADNTHVTLMHTTKKFEQNAVTETSSAAGGAAKPVRDGICCQNRRWLSVA
jgi:hypothetical protein